MLYDEIENLETLEIAGKLDARWPSICSSDPSKPLFMVNGKDEF